MLKKGWELLFRVGETQLEDIEPFTESLASSLSLVVPNAACTVNMWQRDSLAKKKKN